MEKINYPEPKKTPVGGGITYLVDTESVQFNVDKNGEASAVATGKNSSFKTYTALVSQSGTSAPTAIVLYNEFDEEFTFSYLSEGKYTINSAKGYFKENKVALLTSGGEGNNLIVSTPYINNNSLGFGSLYIAQDIPAPANDFAATTIEIKVYN